MPVRVNDPKSLEEWIVKTDQRLRDLEARRLDAAAGLQKDEATKEMSAKISEDSGNAAKIGEDGGIYSENTTQSIEDHTPLYIQKFMTANQSIPTAADTLVSWGGQDIKGTWTNDATSITIPETDFYQIAINWQWTNNATGVRAVHMTVNSTVVTTGSKYASTFPSTTLNETAHNLIGHGLFNSGDILRVYVFQSSGVALNGGGPYFGDIRGRWSIVKVHDAENPTLVTDTADTA